MIDRAVDDSAWHVRAVSPAHGRKGKRGTVMDDVKLGPITRESGVAGQFAYSVSVTYPGEDARTVRFVGSTYGGPIVMVTGTGMQTFVKDPERFGTFCADWVRKFFAAS